MNGEELQLALLARAITADGFVLDVGGRGPAGEFGSSRPRAGEEGRAGLARPPADVGLGSLAGLTAGRGGGCGEPPSVTVGPRAAGR